ncbi:MAG: 50S ribosomal protein L17 [Candidatus Peregrinibacteria bacterium]
MRHKVKKVKLGVNKGHTTSMLRNLAMAVIIYEKVKTTEHRAKMTQPFVERLINIAKRKDRVASIREIEKLLQHQNSSKKIFEVLVEKYKDRNSGYTRITRLGYRKGDNAPVVQIELI